MLEHSIPVEVLPSFSPCFCDAFSDSSEHIGCGSVCCSRLFGCCFGQCVSSFCYNSASHILCAHHMLPHVISYKPVYHSIVSSLSLVNTVGRITSSEGKVVFDRVVEGKRDNILFFFCVVLHSCVL